MTGREGARGPEQRQAPRGKGGGGRGAGGALGERGTANNRDGHHGRPRGHKAGQTDTERLTSQTQTEGPPAAEDRGGDRDTGRQWEAGPDGWGGGRMKRDTLREMGRGEPHITKRLLSARPGVWGPARSKFQGLWREPELRAQGGAGEGSCLQPPAPPPRDGCPRGEGES